MAGKRRRAAAIGLSAEAFGALQPAGVPVVFRWVAYPELSPKLAMRIGKRATLGELDAKGWSAFGPDAGVGLPLIRRRVFELSRAVMTRAADVAGEVMRPDGPISAERVVRPALTHALNASRMARAELGAR